MDGAGHSDTTRRAFGSAAALGLTSADIEVAVKANLDEDDIQSDSAIHFDNCAFGEGVDKIRRDWDFIWQQNNRFSLDSIRALGRVMHTVQDFYAHSNWIELHQDSSPVPVWDLLPGSLPTGICSGTWAVGNPKRCKPGTPSHGHLNKDTRSSNSGRKVVRNGPNSGKTLYQLACDAALRASQAEADRFISGVTAYRITTSTGSRINAGTDASVYIVLHGRLNQAVGKIYLTKTDRDPFERGHTDVFTVGLTQDFSTLQKITIGYDMREYLGDAPGWFLKEVLVENTTSGKEWKFPCGQWLDADTGDGRTVRDLTPA